MRDGGRAKGDGVAGSEGGPGHRVGTEGFVSGPRGQVRRKVRRLDRDGAERGVPGAVRACGDRSPVKGQKHDNGKLRFDLVDDAAEEEFVAVLTYGAVLYEPDGWRHVPDAEARYFAALRRHLAAHRRGELLDSETGLFHLAAAKCCVHFLLGLALAEHGPAVGSTAARLPESLENARRIRAKRASKKR